MSYTNELGYLPEMDHFDSKLCVTVVNMQFKLSLMKRTKMWRTTAKMVTVMSNSEALTVGDNMEDSLKNNNSTKVSLSFSITY